MKNTTEPIDFVILYCDGKDPVFRARRQKYLTPDLVADTEATGEARTRDMGTLPLWFRAVEANAPWVRTVHFVNDGQVPEWLDRSNPKLHLVDLTDFIPARYLPLFNSCAIEMFLHKIDGLAEQFVYFNDDMFLNAPLEPDDFFHEGKPRLAPRFTNRECSYDTLWHHHLFNDIRAVNRHCLSSKNVFKMICRSTGKGYIRDDSRTNFALLMARALTHSGYPFLRSEHQAHPMLKSSCERMCALEPDLIEQTATHRFREYSDVNQDLFYAYDVCSCNFEKSLRTKVWYSLREKFLNDILDVIRNAQVQLLCINDYDDVDFESVCKVLLQGFLARYPKPSSFERIDSVSN